VDFSSSEINGVVELLSECVGEGENANLGFKIHAKSKPERAIYNEFIGSITFVVSTIKKGMCV
jgi:hypothetical protein